ncbi:DUF3653 domain-containing protein [Frateuria aurantia]|uniref:DUF3653 domain-containing protein n=1 Tax=Frateuria aurantia TaxID=81475 RepID=UPI003CE44CE8
MLDRWKGRYIREDAIYAPAGKPFRFELLDLFFLTIERARFWQLDYDRPGSVQADAVTRPKTKMRPRVAIALHKSSMPT